MDTRRSTPVRHNTIPPEACSTDLRRRLLRESPFFADLTGGDIDRVNARFNDVGYEPGRAIIREGDPATRLGIVAAGVVKLFNYGDSGNLVLIDVLGPGDHFGSIAGFGPDTYQESAQASDLVCALQIDASVFRTLLETIPAIAVRAVEVLSNRLRLSHELVRQLGAHNAESRVAYVLKRLATRVGRAWEHMTLIDVSLSREEIAAMAGIQTETCSRILSAMRRDGIVEAGRGWVAVRDPARLE